jgi:hypothetical protein
VVSQTINKDLQTLLEAKGAPAALLPLVGQIPPKRCLTIARELADVPVLSNPKTARLWSTLVYSESPLVNVTRDTRIPRAILDVHSEDCRALYFCRLTRQLS